MEQRELHIHNHHPSKSGGSGTSRFHLSRSLTYYHHNRRRPGAPVPVVLYTTSLRGIRRTYEDCCSLRAILRGFRVAFDERDLAMDASYRKELQSLLLLLAQGGAGAGAEGKPRSSSSSSSQSISISLPQLFVGGKLVGGAEEVRQLHEDGELRKLLEGAPRVMDPCYVCPGCGGARFLPCRECSGSRKVFSEETGRMARCGECNENGLVRCPSCSPLGKPHYPTV